MPTWNAPPEQDLDDALGEIWTDLEESVRDNPRFEDLTGLPITRLTQHAISAVSGFLKRDAVNLTDPSVWVQVYCLGFVVGTKYGERRARTNE